MPSTQLEAYLIISSFVNFKETLIFEVKFLIINATASASLKSLGTRLCKELLLFAETPYNLSWSKYFSLNLQQMSYPNLHLMRLNFLN